MPSYGMYMLTVATRSQAVARIADRTALQHYYLVISDCCKVALAVLEILRSKRIGVTLRHRHVTI